MNFQTFSELAFSFSLTIDTIYQAMAFSLIMGLGGSSVRPSQHALNPMVIADSNIHGFLNQGNRRF
jgi:hypothetical protein